MNRFSKHDKSNHYINRITDYPNNSTQVAEQKLFDLGLTPSQVCRDEYPLSDEDLAYFKYILDKDLKFNVQMQANILEFLSKYRTKLLKKIYEVDLSPILIKSLVSSKRAY